MLANLNRRLRLKMKCEVEARMLKTRRVREKRRIALASLVGPCAFALPMGWCGVVIVGREGCCAHLTKIARAHKRLLHTHRVRDNLASRTVSLLTGTGSRWVLWKAGVDFPQYPLHRQLYRHQLETYDCASCTDLTSLDFLTTRLYSSSKPLSFSDKWAD